MGWTDSRIDLLKTLWAEGLSASQIAGRMGISRSAVIGKVWRLGVQRTSHNSPHARRPSSLKKKKYKAKPDSIYQAPKFTVEPLPEGNASDVPTKTLLELDDRCCRFRIDKPFHGEPYGFCGKKTVVGLSWCPEHLKRVVHPDQYVTVITRAKEKAKEREDA